MSGHLKSYRTNPGETGKAARAKFVVAAAVLLLIVAIALLGTRLHWWGYATTELGPLPSSSGGVVVHQPRRDDFSTAGAWDDYQAHWRDPYWIGEHPDGYRYKIASFVESRRAGYACNAFVAGCVAWRFSGGTDDEEAACLAELVGASEFYFTPEYEVRFASGEETVYRRLMLYFDDGTDIWEKAGEVERAAEASGRDFHGAAELVPLDSAWLPSPQKQDSP